MGGHECRYSLIMSTAEGWDFTVPDDEAELLDQLRRHGVVPGKRFTLLEQSEPDPQGPHVGSGATGAAAAGEPRLRRRLRFAGMIAAEPDLSENFDRYLAQSYGDE